MTYYVACRADGRRAVKHASRSCTRLSLANDVVAVRESRVRNLRQCRYCCPDEWVAAEAGSREYALGLFEQLKGDCEHV